MSASLSARAALVAPASRVASKSGKKQRAAARRPARTARAHRGLVVRAGDLDDELAAINAAIEALKKENDAMLSGALESVATVVETPPPAAAPPHASAALRRAAASTSSSDAGVSEELSPSSSASFAADSAVAASPLALSVLVERSGAVTET